MVLALLYLHSTIPQWLLPWKEHTHQTEESPEEIYTDLDKIWNTKMEATAQNDTDISNLVCA